MNHRIITAFSAIACLFIASARCLAGDISFTLTMENPSNHLYHVVMKCDGLKGETQDLKMPVWTPGYYVIQNFQANVENFSAADPAGKPLTWEKATTNCWRVKTGTASAMTINYDVRATRAFVGSVFLDDKRGYVSPAGTFMHLAGQIIHPVTVTVVPDPAWDTVATGMDPVSKSKPHTLYAPDFDVLYDSPILMGKLTKFPSFEIKGVPHNFVAFNPGTEDVAQFMKDLKAVLEAGIAIIGDIPYKHYTFLAIGPGGGGGIEHLNSASVSFSGAGVGSRRGRNSQLSFLAHEYFHNFNVKRIRPIELGPFDYDKENRTRMLWVSEGLTSYYANIMLARSGMYNSDEVLDEFQRSISSYENNSGHLYQSVSQASWDVWSQGQGTGGGGRRGGAGGAPRVVKTISYYAKGPPLGLMLDFKIRYETKNKKSLDDVMRTLYQTYYKDKKRGWTEQEFRAVCEKTAGVDLSEFFEFVYTTADVDYGKYYGYAGLDVAEPVRLPDAYLGAVVEDRDGKLIVGAVETGTGAHRAKLAVNDEIKSCDGATVNARELNAAVTSKKPGDALKLVVIRSGSEREVPVVLGNKFERSFKIRPSPTATAQQTAIFKSWLGQKN